MAGRQRSLGRKRPGIAITEGARTQEAIHYRHLALTQSSNVNKTFARFLATLAIAACIRPIPQVCAAVVANPPTTAAADVCDVWLINSRHLPCPSHHHGISRRLTYQRLDDRCFVAASEQEFLATLDPAQMTCFFVHGNRMTNVEAQQLGLTFRRRLLGSARIPFRFVIWSWPSEKITGPVRDARAKAARADGESYYLGSVLSLLPVKAHVSLVGYSFGARTITGSLQLLGGGMACGNSLALSSQPMVRPRVVLLAAAVPRQWLLPGGANELAPLQADQLALFYNPRDLALKHFPHVFRPGHPAALGFEGISPRQLAAASDVLLQYDVSAAIGCSHSLSRYIDSSSIMCTVRRLAVEPPTRRTPTTQTAVVP
jgi:hypothetical protein